MIKRFLGFLAIVIGCLCFLMVGGNSMKYGHRPFGHHQSTEFYLYLLLLYLIAPIVGFFLVKWGVKILNKTFKDQDDQIK